MEGGKIIGGGKVLILDQYLRPSPVGPRDINLTQRGKAWRSGVRGN